MSRLSSNAMNDIGSFLSNVMNELARKDNPDQDGIDIIHDGTKLILPADPEKMSYRRGIEVLMAHEAAAIQEYEVFERIPGMPYDAATAFAHVIRERYGIITTKTKQTIFGPKPPRLQIVKTGDGPDDFIEVPIGVFKLTDIEATIETGFADPGPDSRSLFMDFYVQGKMSFQDRKIVMDLITATKAYLAKSSIYRGKALRLRVDDDGELSELVQPEFIDLSAVDVNGLVLNRDIERLLNMTLITPIKHKETCRRHNIPLKRGILLYGPYGTGKSLTASTTARHAIDNGWTFVTVDNAEALAQTLEFAKQFQPCIVFAEDIDRAVSLDRDDDTNDIVNVIDSALNKKDEVMVVLTTNHVEKLPPVLLRHGRLDALVPIGLPDADAAQRLIKLYAGDLLRDGENLAEAGKAAEGFMPSTIREALHDYDRGNVHNNQ